jgi:archaellum component FlaG (FlaF/FlaG flagellin family)
MVTISSGGSIEQVVEQASIPAGTYILSWTGTATGRVYNTGATPPAYAASPIQVTLDGSQNVEVEFTASGGTKTLYKVQLEQALVSVNATLVSTPFEQRVLLVQS